MGDSSGIEEHSAPSRSPPRRARPTLHGRRTIWARTGCSATCAADWRSWARQWVTASGSARAISSSSHATFAHWLLSRTGSWDILPHIEEFVAAARPGATITRAACDSAAPLFDFRARRPRRSARRHSKGLPGLAKASRRPTAAHSVVLGMRSRPRRGGTCRRRATTHEALRGESLPWALADLALVADEVGCTTELAGASSGPRDEVDGRFSLASPRLRSGRRDSPRDR